MPSGPNEKSAADREGWKAMHKKKKSGRGFPFAIMMILALIIVAVVFILRSCGDRGDDPGASPSPSAMVSPSPHASEEPSPSPSPSPSPIPSPTPSPSPSPSEEPSPSPAPSPTPTGMETVASGSFSSNTGTALNLVVSWTSYTNGSEMVVDVSASVSSYSLTAGAIYGGLVFTVGGESQTFNSPAIDYEGDTPATTPLGSCRFVLPQGSSGSVAVSALWNYRGTYSEEEFDSITAAGEARLG